MIFSTVLGPQEPAFTVGSLAISATGRPATIAMPVTTPSAPKPSCSQFARSASSVNESASTSRATRSRTGSLPWSRDFSWCRSGPPPRARSSASFRSDIGPERISGRRAAASAARAGSAAACRGGRRSPFPRRAARCPSARAASCRTRAGRCRGPPPGRSGPQPGRASPCGHRSSSRGPLLPAAIASPNTMALVTTEDRGAVRHLVLNRPEKRNALNEEAIRTLAAEIEGAAADDSVRVVVLRGEGPMFSSGMDLNDLRALSGQAERTRDFRRPILHAWNLLEAAGRGRARQRQGADHDRQGHRRPRGAPDRLRQPDRGCRRARRRDRGARERPAGVRAEGGGPGEADHGRRGEAGARADARAGGGGPGDAGRLGGLRGGRAGILREARPALRRPLRPLAERKNRLQKCDGPGCRGPGPLSRSRGRVGGTHMCRKPAPPAEFGLYPGQNGQTPEIARTCRSALAASHRTPAEASVMAATTSQALA